jgi:hypothetical protein
MPDRETEPHTPRIALNPRERTTRATIIAVPHVGPQAAVVAYRCSDTERVQVSRVLVDQWPPESWPPAVGDEVQVRIAPELMLLSRPETKGGTCGRNEENP